MATAKKSNTSKTARVMNLLSKSREEAPAEQNVAPTPAPAEPESVEVSAQSVPAAEPAAPAAKSSMGALGSEMPFDEEVPF